MDFDSLSKEQQVMVAMRKTLANIIKDTTPEPGMIHPLSKDSVEDIKACFALIAARERELMEKMGVENNARPRFTDEPQSAGVVKFHKP
ncbi:MAG: segregation and condensation protein A [gamma proteobacterium symbiont of Lucinoma myriamae]|nr:segregation and condensation protein A [gamma proteobacterium symbiont of Lucinoma myriamae]MCU7817425.1 segregation and condensation protein A [gamma proteobacterium symbiont of Lucinoma myriamae]MCU7831940.1 segregation and condensation protein A [gamma proteobacterium symbiont of Lucinoma myriamae]